MKTFHEDEIINAVNKFPGGCKEKKNEFLNSLGINQGKVYWGVGLRLYQDGSTGKIHDGSERVFLSRYPGLKISKDSSKRHPACDIPNSNVKTTNRSEERV